MNAPNARATAASRFGSEFRPVEPLGNRDRKDYLQRDPRLSEHFSRCANASRYSKRVFVLRLGDNTIVGWYSLVASIAGSTDQPFPVLCLADIAVVDEFKGTGVYDLLQKDADQRIAALRKSRIVELIKEGLRR
jgi:hypothetical protein